MPTVSPHTHPCDIRPAENLAPCHVLQQLKMAQDISARARQLLHASSPGDPASNALKDLRRISGLKALVIFQKQTDAAGRPFFEWRYQTGDGPDQADQGGAYKPACDTVDKLAVGHSVRAHFQIRSGTAEATHDEKDASPWLMLPINVGRAWWGGLALDCGDRDPKKDNELREAFATAVDLFGIYFERQIASHENAESDKLAGALEMAGTVCHKLNQPMQVILGYASMVTSGDISEPDQVCEIVKMIEDETRRMGIITKNLMGITKYRTVETPNVGAMCDVDSQSAAS